MIATQVIDALQLPNNCKVEQRVPKKTLIEHAAPNAADKRYIQDGIEELFWVAALKPANIGVPHFRDEVREYLEIAVLSLALRPDSKPMRLIELIHRSIPYPVFLVTSNASISVAHKRYSEGQKDKYVVEDLAVAEFDAAKLNAVDRDFLQSLALSSLPTKDLCELYQGWFNRITAFRAAAITGIFSLPPTNECAISIKERLGNYSRLTRDIQSLRIQAAKERQLNRRVDLNLQIKRLETELKNVAETLGGQETR